MRRIKRIARPPSAAMVVAVIALVAAIGGTAFAANQINGKDIKNRSIRGGKIAKESLGGQLLHRGTISQSKIKNRTIRGGKIATESLGGRLLHDATIGGEKIDGKAITTDKIADQAVTGGQVKDDSLTGKQIAENSLGMVPSAFNAAAVDGTTVHRLFFKEVRNSPTRLLLNNVKGLTIAASCDANGNPRMSVRSTDANTTLFGTLNGDGFGTGNLGQNQWVAIVHANQQGDPLHGAGTMTWAKSDGTTVTVQFMVSNAPTLGNFNGCSIAGIALAR